MIPRILCLILSTTLALAAVELDSRISDNLKQIFGTPEHPLNSTEEVNVKKNIKDIFNPADKTGENRAGEEISLDPSTDDPKLTPCTRSDNQPGVCVVYYQCDPASKKLITDGDTLIDIRISACPHYLDVCCLPEAINTTEPVTTAAPPANPEEEKPEACGYSHLGDENPIRIMNDGTLAEYLEFPWMVAVLRRSKSGGADAAWSQKDYLGGGSLIHPRAVLTTAHKIEGVTADDLKIRAGEWDTQTRSEIYPEQEMNVQKIVRHENFYRPSVLNSVALLFLERPVTRMPNVGTACLGRRLPEPGTRCISMGWGKDKFFAQDSYATFLKKVELPLVSRSSCQTALRRTRLGSFFQLHNSLTCAGGEEGKDTCGGDGGSPLVCHIGDEKDLRYAIYGMVAYGIGCGDRGVPGVYVDTTEFYTWIEEKMKADGLSGETYTVDETVG